MSSTSLWALAELLATGIALYWDQSWSHLNYILQMMIHRALVCPPLALLFTCSYHSNLVLFYVPYKCVRDLLHISTLTSVHNYKTGVEEHCLLISHWHTPKDVLSLSFWRKTTLLKKQQICGEYVVDNGVSHEAPVVGLITLLGNPAQTCLTFPHSTL